MQRADFRFFLTVFASIVLWFTTFQMRDVNALSSNRGRRDFVDNQVLVSFKPATSPERAHFLIQETNAEIAGGINKLGIYILTVPKGEVETSISTLRRSKEILLAEPNYYVYADETFPNDPSLGFQYGLTNIRAPQGWDLSTGATWVTIAVIDTGVDLSHPDLAYKTIAGYDFVNNDTVPQDDNGHGTHVAGIAAAMSNNGEGIAGVSWGANIMPLKVLDSAGNGTYANVAAAIIWATDHGAQVINMSLGGPYPSSTLESAINYAYTNGMVQVAAAGNTGTGSVLYPAKYAPVIAVAATDNLNNRAIFSNYGPEVDLAAPGVSIYSLYPSGGYGYRSGTSMAAPFVSGLAAILIGLPQNYDAGLVEMQMETTALDLGGSGWDFYYGAGLVQMDVAIQHAIPPTATPTLTPTATFTHTATATITKTPTATPPPIRPPRTKTPTQHPLIWPPRLFPSPTLTATPIPSTTISPAQENDSSLANNLTSASSTNTSLPILGTGGTKNSTSWSLCLGTLFILMGAFLWIYSQPNRHHLRRNGRFLEI